MTFWSVVSAVLTAFAIYKLIEFGVDTAYGYVRRKKIDRILDELDEFWAEQAALTKPVKKKAVAKKK
jgi:hypothetical protein